MSENRNKVSLPVNISEYRVLTDKFLNWFINARPREIYIYYRGASLSDNLKAKYVKDISWVYACEGKVYLYRMRDPTERNTFLYMAEKASRRIPSLIPKKTL